MNSDHRYILEPYKGMSTRFRCPACQHRNKTFSRYVDTQTGSHIDERVGRCERVDKCGYAYSPKQFFTDNGVQPDLTDYSNRKPQQPRLKPSFIDPAIFKRSLSGYGANRLISFLHTLFGSETVQRLIKDYFIGTSSHWPGSTVFWQIDKSGKIRTGKIMLYDPLTGKRVKDPYSHISWAHKAMNLDNFNLNQCLFGEHLLNLNGKPAAVVESEKTAVIASAFFPQYNWLACGSLQNLSIERCKALAGRMTVLYPDLNAFEKWKLKAEEFGFKVSSVLEESATAEGRAMGLDLADYLISSKVSEGSVPVLFNQEHQNGAANNLSHIFNGSKMQLPIETHLY
jgi:hypothetical protein